MTPRAGAAPQSGSFSRRQGRLSLPVSLRLRAHRASSATLGAAYPFLAGRPCTTGALVGMDGLTDGPFCFDPWALYAAGELTNPNVVLAGMIGQGKSALAKSLAVRAIASGRRVYVPGDPKGEWGPVAQAVGGVVVPLRPGGGTRLNPLDAHGVDPHQAHGPRLRLLMALAETTLRRDLRPAEHGALDAAVAAVERRAQPTLPDVVAALAEPHASGGSGATASSLAQDGRDLVHGLRRLIHGDLAGLFDGPSTQVLDAAAPMTVLDLSGLGSNDEALALAMTCASGWLEHALSGATVKRWVIYDEAWRLLRSVPAVRRMQSQWKLSRAYGIANLMILHRLSDLDAVGAAGTEARALADGLLADCSTRVVVRPARHHAERPRTDRTRAGPAAGAGPRHRVVEDAAAHARGPPPPHHRRAGPVRHRCRHAGGGLMLHRDDAARLAEQVTLGSLILQPQHLTQVRPWPRPADFADTLHRQVYSALCERQAAGETIDPQAMAHALVGRAPGMSPAIRVHDLIRVVPPVAHAETYARIVAEAGLRREVAGLGVLLRAGALQCALSRESVPMTSTCSLVDAALVSVARRWDNATGIPRPPAEPTPIQLHAALRNPDLRLGADKLLRTHPGRDLKAEHAHKALLVGALITHPRDISTIGSCLPPQRISSPPWRTVYGAVLDLHETGQPVDLVTVAHATTRLSHHGQPHRPWPSCTRWSTPPATPPPGTSSRPCGSTSSAASPTTAPTNSSRAPPTPACNSPT